MSIGTAENRLRDKFSLFPIRFEIQSLTSCNYNQVFCNLIGDLKSKIGPAPCDKKCCLEHQTLFARARGSGHETSLFLGFSRKLRSANMRLTQSACIASRLQHLLGCVAFVNFHPQEVFATNAKTMLTGCAVLEQNCHLRHYIFNLVIIVLAIFSTLPNNMLQPQPPLYVRVGESVSCNLSWLCTGVYRVVPESPRWLLLNGQEEQARAVLAGFARGNGVTLPEGKLKKPEQSKNGGVSTRDLFKGKIIRQRTTILVFAW